MARRVFYSFHYKPDCARAAQVRNMGVIEGNSPVSDNDWEAITQGGDAKIRQWIDSQLSGKSCAVVLIGTNTAGRKWIKYEIETAWEDGRGLLGVYIHNLKNFQEEQASKGSNPFYFYPLPDGTRLSDVVKAYDPPYTTSTYVYNHIKENLAAWVEEAIDIRAQH